MEFSPESFDEIQEHLERRVDDYHVVAVTYAELKYGKEATRRNAVEIERIISGYEEINRETFWEGIKPEIDGLLAEG